MCSVLSISDIVSPNGTIIFTRGEVVDTLTQVRKNRS